MTTVATSNTTLSVSNIKLMIIKYANDSNKTVWHYNVSSMKRNTRQTNSNNQVQVLTKQKKNYWRPKIAILKK